MQSRPLAESSGISTRATDRLTFFIGSGLAGVAGVALTLVGSISPNLGTAYIVDAFLVVVVGGIGEIRGAVIAKSLSGGNEVKWNNFMPSIRDIDCEREP